MDGVHDEDSETLAKSHSRNKVERTTEFDHVWLIKDLFFSSKTTKIRKNFDKRL